MNVGMSRKRRFAVDEAATGCNGGSDCAAPLPEISSQRHSFENLFLGRLFSWATPFFGRLWPGGSDYVHSAAFSVELLLRGPFACKIPGAICLPAGYTDVAFSGSLNGADTDLRSIVEC
jgi:hypothetical protein